MGNGKGEGQTALSRMFRNDRNVHKSVPLCYSSPLSHMSSWTRGMWLVQRELNFHFYLISMNLNGFVQPSGSLTGQVRSRRNRHGGGNFVNWAEKDR